MRGRSTWLISAAGTYNPRYMVYMRFLSYALTNQGGKEKVREGGRGGGKRGGGEEVGREGRRR